MHRQLALTSLLISCFVPVANAQSCNTADRAVMLVLDASGSMNARLPNGETRFQVAKRAIKGVAAFVPAQAQLSLRMYGTQAASKQKSCQDSHLAVPFGPAGAAGVPIAASVDGAKAQGYTPIAYSLGQAAGEFPAAAKERVVVLVSDGKETCQGDPVVAARALASKGIVVHAVGFIVDTAARMQLQTIARVTGGSYFDAPVGPELPDTLKKALNACRTKVAVLPKKPQPGKLRTTSAQWLSSHPIFNAETGERVGDFSSVRHEVTLPAGIYEVRFGKATWRGIEVRPGQTTTIEPAVLELTNRVGGAALIDSETGEQHGSFDAVSSKATVMPGVYDLQFRNDHRWRFIRLDGGKTVTLALARVVLGDGVPSRGRIVTSEGKVVWTFDAVTRSGSMPPGDYVIEIDGNKIPYTATPGDTLEIKPQ